MKTILFQGDSITDAGRNRANGSDLGSGYASLAAAELALDYPGQFRVLNRGVTSDTAAHLYARMQSDFISLQPDYLTILVGVNDAAAGGLSDMKFRRVYAMLIEELREELPDTKIYIIEPFVLKGSFTEYRWDELAPEVWRRAESAGWIAEQYGLPFIPLQDRLNELCSVCPPDYWLGDGVHPTAAGHELIAREIMKALKKDIG